MSNRLRKPLSDSRVAKKPTSSVITRGKVTTFRVQDRPSHSGVNKSKCTTLSSSSSCATREKVRGKNVALSTDSTTNLSDKEKSDSAVALKKEIDEWKHQEALRTRVQRIPDKIEGKDIL